jgi:hypothetical protein
LRAARSYGLTISGFRALPETDRLLALALQIHEDAVCPGCGQLVSECMDPDLLDEWTTMEPHRDGACTALARARERNKDREHPGALRFVVGLKAGWEDRKASAVAGRERAAADAE